MQNNDKIIKFLAYNGKVNIVCASTTYLVEQARKIHDTSPVATAAMGRLLTISAIMGSNLKDEKSSITLQLNGRGPIGSLVAVANNVPQVKVYVQNPVVDLPLNSKGKLDVGKAVGKAGFLNVIKDIGMKEPYVGMVPLISGEIAEDFTQYFATSEQKPSAVALGVLVNNKGVKASGGYVLTLMPDATDAEIRKIENAISKCDSISKMLDDGLTLVEIARKVTGDENIQIIEENICPKYECDCNREKFERGLISLGNKQLKEIIEEDGKAEVNCHFCNKKYNFTKEDLEKLIRDINKE